MTITDGAGTVATGRLEPAERGSAVVEVIRAERRDRPGPEVSVALAPPGADRLSWAVQKLGELGVDEILVIETERTVRRSRRDETDPLLDRLRAVAREAAMQSRQAFVARIEGVRPLRSVLQGPPGAVVAMMASAGTALDTALPEAARGVRLVVGPEGGFSETESRLLIDAGAATATLGPNILRTETAAVVAAALALARYGRLG